MKKFFALLPFLIVIGACTHGNCRSQKNMAPKAPQQEELPMSSSAPTERVKIHKPDGSLQCGQGKAIPAGEMQKELKNIKVHSAQNLNDGMMRIQVCGSPTGFSNVYEIDRSELEAALKLGFKEWTAE